MAFLTAETIAEKAENIYFKFLKEWISGSDADFFPYRVRARFSIDPKDSKGTIQASEKLLAKSKSGRGWGYTVHRERIRTRDFGNNQIPIMVTIDTLDDLLRLANRKDEFQATSRVAVRVREAFPQLSDWLKTNVRSIHRYSEPIGGLILVAQYFQKNPGSRTCFREANSCFCRHEICPAPRFRTPRVVGPDSAVFINRCE